METDAEWGEESVRATAIGQYGRQEVRCRIEIQTWSDSQPSVHFARRSPDADVETMRSWSAVATGQLAGPQGLREWMQLFTVFQAAVEALVEEISGSVSSGQISAYESRCEGPHPIFSVEHRPERKSL